MDSILARKMFNLNQLFSWFDANKSEQWLLAADVRCKFTPRCETSKATRKLKSDRPSEGWKSQLGSNLNLVPTKKYTEKYLSLTRSKYQVFRRIYFRRKKKWDRHCVFDRNSVKMVIFRLNLILFNKKWRIFEKNEQ